MTTRLDQDSEVIQTYWELKESGYSFDGPGEFYRETPLYSSSITQVESGPLTSIRTRNVAKAIRSGYCAFVIITAGHGFWIDQHQQRALSPGCILFMEANRQFTFHFPSVYGAISFNVPKWLLSEQGLNDLGHGAIVCDLQFVEVVSTAVSSAQDSQNPTSRQKRELGILKILSRLFGKAGQQPLMDNNAKSVQSLIQNHAMEEDFSIDWLVEHCNFSRRYLFKLFENQSVSLSQQILQARLHNGFQLLSDESKTFLNIGDVAVQSGFKTQAHFSRLFKQHYAITPKALRKALLQA